ncbi:hypothetical protein [Prescottella equi]|uniref:hypothetical protein n=1 Tax=Rhodococcus hoagii TaxID=43767 RepID=UPI00197DF742|nr:hypothetical protein [Prescottella equi]NKU94064.1 hypothetical protein [Prescottella equi]
MTLTRDDVIDVLTAAASVDLRKIGDADVAGWSATLRADLDRDLALEALRVHYATSAERLMPAHINKLAVQIRRDRAEREKAAEIITRPDRQLGGLPINADGDPVWTAYEVNDAIGRECPTCKQPPDHACINLATDTARKIPCQSRLKVQG